MRHMIRNCRVLLIVLVLSVILPIQYVDAEEESQVIRVGFPIQEGLTMIDAHGDYTGYTYDYIKEVAQYTGWTFEFVQVEGDINQQLVELLDMLEKGEIDLLGAMSYNEQIAQVYDFPSENYGNAYSVLAVKEDEDRIDEYNLTDYKGLRVALLKQAENNNEKFFQYAKLNGIDYEIVWCETDEEQYSKINSGEADALISVDVSLEGSFRPIAKYSPVPFYFAITKGNSRVVNGLNQAITYISQVNPMLQTNLYNKYFSWSSSQMILNSQEKAYIEEHPTLKVLVHDGFGPLQYYDQKNEICGVAKDLLDNIAEKTGWKTEFQYTDTYTEFEDALSNKTADLILSVQYDYDTALHKDLLLSNPYLETESVLVAHEGVSAVDLEGKKKAVYKGDRREEESDNVLYFDSIEDSLEAVESGKCDYTYTNSYTASYYQRKNRQEHTVVYPQAGGDNVKYSLGILHKDDQQLSAIINKGINSIDSRELESYIYNNAQQNQKVTLRSFIKDNPFIFAGSIALVAVCLLAILYKYLHSQMRMKKQIELENTRYRILSDILKEVTFSYDYGSDRLTLSQEGIRLFATDGHIEHYSQYKTKMNVHGEGPSLKELLMQKKDLNIELLLKPPGTEEEWYRVIIKVIKDGEKAVSAIGRIQNIHQERLEKERLQEKSRLDSLTRIYNNAAMKKEVTEWLEEKKGPLAFMIIDLDGFKTTNDQYGHYIGDQVLIQLGAALREVFHENGAVGRLGGDEFVTCMKYEGREWIEKKCQEFFQCLESKRNASGYPIPTVSIGISISKAGDDFATLYQRADTILYEVKKSGKNNFQIEN